MAWKAKGRVSPAPAACLGRTSTACTQNLETTQGVVDRLVLGAIVEARTDAVLAELVRDPQAQAALVELSERLEPTLDEIAEAADGKRRP